MQTDSNMVGGGNVLVVDDSPEYLELVSAFLEARGHSVRKAVGGEEALKAAEQSTPDVVLLDVVMPGLDGFEVCKRLRERWPARQVPVLFLSGSERADYKLRAFETGGVDYVTKSVRMDEVIARVETHLELKRRSTALEQANTELRKVEDYRRRFITSLVHDIKNPLVPVLKNTEWLLKQKHEDEEVVEVVRDTHVAANHMHRMVLSLLDLAKSAEWKLHPQRRVVSVGPWLEETLSLTRLQLRSWPERLVVANDVGSAFFDPTLISRVLQNTIDNALKYSPKREPVMVDVRIEGIGLRLVVEDRGHGVKPEDRERIFASWVRVDENDSVARDSHGIGLAFCRQAVEAHGGRMTVEDAQPCGARFVIELPGE